MSRGAFVPEDERALADRLLMHWNTHATDVFACKDIVSTPVRLANSIWQGVKIGLAAEPVKSPALNWLDQASDLIF